MKSLRLYGPGDTRIQEEPKPQPQAGEALVRVTAVGLCGSDLHWFSEGGIGDARLEQPLVLGHEGVGVIVDGPRKGRRAAIDPAIPCESCEFCLGGDPNLCSNIRFAGHGREDGQLREYLAWPERCLVPLPDNISDDEGVLLEPLGVALHAVDLGHLRVGMTVAVFGCGPVGVMVAQLARLSGAKSVYVTETLPHRLEIALAHGFTGFSADGEEAVRILTATRGRGVDVAFEVAGEEAAVEAAFAAVRPGGRVVLIGIPGNDRTAFNAGTARRKGLTIKLVRRMKHTYGRAISLVGQGLVELRSLPAHHFPLEQGQAAFELAARREGMKVIVNPTRT
ncbi:MAG: alcohol dehydrogenase catalytic domain-containing protein [Firmicutes bacterium]|nr:alcohol dehydrogenase catalytic domain-containing protein [Bacillota bacterium]